MSDLAEAAPTANPYGRGGIRVDLEGKLHTEVLGQRDHAQAVGRATADTTQLSFCTRQGYGTLRAGPMFQEMAPSH